MRHSRSRLNDEALLCEPPRVSTRRDKKAMIRRPAPSARSSSLRALLCLSLTVAVVVHESSASGYLRQQGGRLAGDRGVSTTGAARSARQVPEDESAGTAQRALSASVAPVDSAASTAESPSGTLGAEAAAEGESASAARDTTAETAGGATAEVSAVVADGDDATAAAAAVSENAGAAGASQATASDGELGLAVDVDDASEVTATPPEEPLESDSVVDAITTAPVAATQPTPGTYSTKATTVAQLATSAPTVAPHVGAPPKPSVIAKTVFYSKSFDRENQCVYCNGRACREIENQSPSICFTFGPCWVSKAYETYDDYIRVTNQSLGCSPTVAAPDGFDCRQGTASACTLTGHTCLCCCNGDICNSDDYCDKLLSGSPAVALTAGPFYKTLLMLQMAAAILRASS